ncbi:hypothetical protein NDU88_001902 [Pleurodeles waltl]|uniref:Uncharacterized protein n=1 Tax=Pleurodeles waltl TaxID=8319 RepID=A0AAV7LYZ3_PLEWA|nr:hypothetical protein NDU88_001902 [Pleurodeles waltl]
MGPHKRTDALQGNTMKQYTTPVPLPQRVARLEVSGDDMRAPLNPEEPLGAELFAAIQGSRVTRKGKIETVVVEVNLLRADLRKVSDKVKVVECSIVELQTGGVAMVGDVGQGFPGEDGGTWWRHSSGLWSESPDWRSCEAIRLVDAGTGGSAVDSHYRVEIQQDRTMGVVATDLVGGTAPERVLGAGGDPAVA